MISLSLIGFTLDLIGKLLVAFTAIRVHDRFQKEHKIDEKVFTEMKREQALGLAGIGLIIVGYLLQLPEKLY